MKSITSPWIKMRTDLRDDPKVVAIAEELGLDQYAVVGRLHAFWAWADRYTADGNALSVTSAFVDQYLSALGFASALRKVGWLAGQEGDLSVPNFEKHNGQSAKRRLLTAQRAKRFRAADERNALSVTKVTHPLTLTLSSEKEEGTGGKPPATPPLPAPKGKRPRALRGAELVDSLAALPLPFADEAFSDAWADWLQYRVVERTDLPPYVPTGVKNLLGKLRSLGAARAVAAIRLSIASNWQGIHEGDRNGGNGSGPSSGYGDAGALFPEGAKPQNLRRRTDGKPGLEPIPEEERTPPARGS